MKFVKILLISLMATFLLSGVALSSKIEVDTQYDFKLALDYAFSARVDTIVLITSGGLYSTADTMHMQIKKPIVIMAKPGLAEKPIFQHGDLDSSVIEIFRVHDDVTFEGVIFDGYNAKRPMKYAVRVGHGPATQIPQIYAKEGLNVSLKNCEFRDFFPPNWENDSGGNAFYFLRPETGEPVIKAGTVRIEDCIFRNLGDEAIRIAETEKYAVTRVVDSLIVRNCTFKNVYAECIRFYADVDTSTEDAYVLMEHLTIDSSATRVAFIKNNQNTIFRDIIVTNSHMPKQYRMDRADYVAQVQQRGSFISNIDTMNITFAAPYSNRISATKGGSVDESTVYGFDPLYENSRANNYTLLASSPAYGIAHDGTALGDLNWATQTSTRLPFILTIVGDGSVVADPPLVAPNYEAGVTVTLTAVPDSGWNFIEWSGDLEGTDNPASLTVNTAKSITATFQQSTGVEDNTEIPVEYSLSQNYPNPFNPSTTISFSLKKSGKASMELFNVMGQKVATIFDQQFTAGSHRIRFNAINLPAGIYFYQLKSGNYQAIKKLTLIK
ncbi:T9SS type A sorting domain-containing protein [candidate division KSB1 bacterium]|nr:T9SS type A sorting domain-containing protein [candidate division KSB1 bacterium]